MITNLICKCHKYFEEYEDASSVSLRDVTRFVILYKWFKESLNEKMKFLDNERYLNNITKYNLEISYDNRKYSNDMEACLLALCHCYYLRISSN